MTGGQVLIIEDDADIALSLQVILERAGLRATRSRDGAEGLRTFHSARPDLVILDVGLPGMDGWTVLERIRDLSDVPILMLTAHGQEADKVRGLNSGADDYLLKPFGNAELAARAQALLRRFRTAARPAGDRRSEAFDDGSVRVNFASHEVTVDGVKVDLTPTEYRLLTALVRHRNQVLSPETLLELAWSDPVGIGPERVKYSVLRLRRKLGTAAGPGSRIEAVRGFGYRYRTTGANPARDSPAKR